MSPSKVKHREHWCKICQAEERKKRALKEMQEIAKSRTIILVILTINYRYLINNSLARNAFECVWCNLRDFPVHAVLEIKNGTLYF